jgi:hypothetical protein
MAKFKPGQSGNPGGRPKGLRAYIQAKCGEDGKALVDAAWSIATDKKASPAARISAMTLLFDRGWGKAAQPLTGDGDNGAGGPVLVKFVDV